MNCIRPNVLRKAIFIVKRIFSSFFDLFYCGGGISIYKKENFYFTRKHSWTLIGLQANAFFKLSIFWEFSTFSVEKCQLRCTKVTDRNKTNPFLSKWIIYMPEAMSGLHVIQEAWIYVFYQSSILCIRNTVFSHAPNLIIYQNVIRCSTGLIFRSIDTFGII